MNDLSLLIDAWPVTHKGQARGYNEDFVAVYEPDDPQQRMYSGNLYVVADGAGEEASGQVASRYAAQKIISLYYKSTEIDLGIRLRRAIQEVNGELYRGIEQDPNLKRVSTTVVAVAVRGEQYHIASVGDSRGYLVRKNQLFQLTRDHSLVAGLVEQGTIKPEEAKEHPQRDVLLRNLGSQPTVDVDIYDGRLAPDDRLILCTSGLTRYVDGQELANVATEAQPTTAAERLVGLANQRGGEDNVTAIVLGARMGIPTPRTALPFAWDGTEPVLGTAAPQVAPPPAPTPQAPLPMQHPTQPPMPSQQPVVPAPAPQMPPSQPPMPPTQPAVPPTQPAVPPSQPAVPPSQPAVPPSQPAVPMAQPPAAPEFDLMDTQIHPRPPFSQPAPGPYATPYGTEPIPQAGQPKTYRPPGTEGASRGIDLGGGSRNIVIGILAVVVLAAAGIVAAVTLLPLLGNGGQGGQGGVPVVAVTSTPDAAGITLPPPTQAVDGGEVAAPAPTEQLVPPGMVLVEAGEFLRGVSDEELALAVNNCIQEGGGACPPEVYDDATPQQNVTLGAFYIDRTEVTNAQYALCVAAGSCNVPVDVTRYDDPAYANHPVTNVTWAQASSYCAWAGKRLPTEAEWEKAARGPDSRIWPWGDTWDPGKANTLAAQLGGPSTVESFAGDASPYGVIGMAGNVSEWVSDWYQGNYENLALVDPQGPLAQPGNEPIKVARGGSYRDLSANARGAMRLDVNSGNGADWLGFRCAASLAAAPTGAPAAAPAEGTGEEAAGTPEATLVPSPTPSTGEAATATLEPTG